MAESYSYGDTQNEEKDHHPKEIYDHPAEICSRQPEGGHDAQKDRQDRCQEEANR